MSAKFKQKLVVGIFAAMIFFSLLFVFLTTFSESFSEASTAGLVIGAVLGQLSLALVGIVGKEALDRAIGGREEDPPPSKNGGSN